MAPSGKRYEEIRERGREARGKSRQHVRPATGLAAHRGPGHEPTDWLLMVPISQVGKLGTEFHSEHLSFKSWKGQDEVQRGGRLTHHPSQGPGG